MSDERDANDGEGTRRGEPQPFRFDDDGVEEGWTSEPARDDDGPASERTDGERGTEPGATPEPRADANADAGADRAPLGDLASRVRERRESRESGADRSDDAPFEEMSAGDVDGEAVWESLSDSSEEAGAADVVDPAAAPDEAGPEREDVEAVPRGEADAARPDHVVPARSFCEQCRHFSEPPAVACTHEGTDIVELVDLDRFRVRGCPVVEERADVTD
jgi:hypothetical protein